jgi:hypothetical protein
MNFAMTTRWVACLLLLFTAAGCASYYRVRDQSSGKVYYTKDYDRADGGAVQFEDAHSRATVTLQSSEITEISRDDYEAELKK